MRKTILLFTLFLFHYFAFAQTPAAVDTVQPAPPDTSAVITRANVPNAPDTGNRKPLAKMNQDSLAFSSEHDYQKAHPSILYTHALKKFTPAFVLCLLFFLGISFWLLLKTSLCRNLSYDPRTNMLRPVKMRPYSYSRLQLFWWTVIILICFTSFFFYTGWLVALNSTIVLLLGGGLAVSIFGNTIDRAQIGKNSEGLVPVRHQDIEETKGILTDILSDEGGISVHRFQAIAFNIIFGLGFIHSFYSFVVAGLYPFIDFEQWQLTLLGISSAGYLGFKANENATETKAQRERQAVEKNKVSLPSDNDGASGAPAPVAGTNAFQKLQANVASR